jgi:hypothetical protein
MPFCLTRPRLGAAPQRGLHASPPLLPPQPRSVAPPRARDLRARPPCVASALWRRGGVRPPRPSDDHPLERRLQVSNVSARQAGRDSERLGSTGSCGAGGLRRTAAAAGRRRRRRQQRRKRGVRSGSRSRSRAGQGAAGAALLLAARGSGSGGRAAAQRAPRCRAQRDAGPASGFAAALALVYRARRPWRLVCGGRAGGRGARLRSDGSRCARAACAARACNCVGRAVGPRARGCRDVRVGRAVARVPAR